MGHILHRGTHTHPVIAAVGLKAIGGLARPQVSHALTTLTCQELMVQHAPISIRREVSSLVHASVLAGAAFQGQSVDRG